MIFPPDMAQGNKPTVLSPKIPINLSAPAWRRGLAVIRWGLVALLLVYMGQLVGSKHLLSQVGALQAALRTHVGAVVLVMLLMPLNWVCEAGKWRQLVGRVVPTTGRQALVGVLTGLPLGLLLSRHVGDWAGRSLRLRADERRAAAGPVLISAFLQFSVTVVAGLSSLWWLGADPHASVQLVTAGRVALTAAGLTAVLLVVIGRVRATGDYLMRWARLRPFVAALASYRYRDLLRALGWAQVRYLIINAQFVLLLWATGVALPWYVLAGGVAFVLAAKSVLPVFNAVGDLGIREVSALYFFAAWQVPELSVLTAGLLLWGINVLLPSLPGLWWVGRTPWLSAR